MGIELWKELVVSLWLIAMICIGVYYSKKQAKLYKKIFHIDN